MRYLSWRWLGWFTIAAAGVHAAGCGSSSGETNNGFGGSASTDSMHATGTGGGATMSSGILAGTGGGHAGTGTGGAEDALSVTPTALQTIDVVGGQPLPTATWQAKYDGGDVQAGWSVDRGEIGSIPAALSPSGVFTASGTVGGFATVTAALTAGGHDYSEKRQVLVRIKQQQNGPTAGQQGEVVTDPGTLTQGGGIGGVGGEGIGGAVTDTGTVAALATPTDDGAALGLKLLYPYDATVFPRGMLAPLIMWDWSTGDADAVSIHLHTKSGSYDWTGTFSAPTILATTGGKFIRHPIPQDVWDAATSSAGGTLPSGGPDTLAIDVVVAKGGVGHGPLTQTWKIAPGRLNGIIYYNSYGTKLAENLGGALGGDGLFGGAVLSIHVGDTGPKLVAGGTGTEAQCRVCHSVAANGSRLLTQHGDSYGTTSAYDLTPTGATEATLALGTTFPAVYPDGSLALGANGTIYPLPDDTTPTTPTGLSDVTDLGSPAFSPDGKLVAFNPMSGASVTTPQKLVVMKFDQATMTFSAAKDVVDLTANPNAEVRPGWPAFLPDGASLVFHQQSAAGLDGNASGTMNTRKGAKAQIAWTSTASAADVTPMNLLNGLDASGASYLPSLATAATVLKTDGTSCAPGGAEICCKGDGKTVDTMNPLHDDDANQNYEPTVNPIASGGYAWVVFTSRRMYGNVAEIPPYCSDPRGVDLVKNITPKKLWVAAVDLDAHAGVDPSHPGFYLPAQELLAGNSRGFWVLDPCKGDGTSCTAGDECCNGFCQPNGAGGALVCSNMGNSGMCSGETEHCDTSADCCDQENDKCVGGFCVRKGPH